MTDVKVEVSLRAFEARCKRYAQTHEGETLKRCRYGTRAYAELGDYYFVGPDNRITTKGWHFDSLEKWARESGVLKPYEVVGE